MTNYIFLTINILCILFLIIFLTIFLTKTNCKCKYLKIIIYFIIGINILLIGFSSVNIYNKYGKNEKIITKKDIYGIDLNTNTDISMKELLYNNIHTLEEDLLKINNQLLINKNNNNYDSELEKTQKLLQNKLQQLKNQYNNKYNKNSISNKLFNIFNFNKNKSNLESNLDSKLYGQFKEEDTSLLYSNF